MIKETLLYTTVIESDVMITREDTFLGASLKLVAVATIFYTIAHFVFHVA